MDNDAKAPEKGMLLKGDLFSGIVIGENKDADYEFDLDGSHVTIAQRVTRPKEDREVLGLLFLMDKPCRFRIDVLVPENCVNAQVSLNDKELLGFFSDKIPEDPEFVQMTHCNDANKYTPLTPGTFQTLNFRWESGDVLKCFFYY
ncbi:MAG: hypothetical protein J5752_04085 [Clostridiales bacterium]|nr:hypothetical protein [Clostridiales bacterium]